MSRTDDRPRRATGSRRRRRGAAAPRRRGDGMRQTWRRLHGRREGLTRKSRAACDGLTPQIIAASSFDTSAALATVAQNYGVRNTWEEIARLLTPTRRDGARRGFCVARGRARPERARERGEVEVTVEAPLRLKLVGVSKSFPGVRANDNVNLSVRPGEIHALLGENGAGKSTLVKMIYGILAPDEGEIVFDGSPARISNPRAARRLGIGMVFQHFSLFEAMTVLENIALGLDSRLSSRELLAEFNRVLEAYHLKLDPRRVVSTLSVGERQRIEIVRALLLKPRLLIMDEPTSVLTPQEVEQLFETLRKLAASGCSILYISHKLHEIVALCDTATILRGGKVVAHCDPKRETSRSMAEMMIGANLKEIAKPPGRGFGPLKLAARGLSLAKPSEFGVALQDVALNVRAGEIFGIAGVAGNGQNELMSAISGETLAPAPGAITIVGREVGRLGVTERRNLGF